MENIEEQEREFYFIWERKEDLPPQAYIFFNELTMQGYIMGIIMAHLNKGNDIGGISTTNGMEYDLDEMGYIFVNHYPSRLTSDKELQEYKKKMCITLE